MYPIRDRGSRGALASRRTNAARCNYSYLFSGLPILGHKLALTDRYLAVLLLEEFLPLRFSCVFSRSARIVRARDLW